MEPENLSSYFNQYKKIKSPEGVKKFKIAVLASSTINGIKEVLSVKCQTLELSTEVLIGDYNQYNQEILDEKSKLYGFEPDLVVLFIDTMSLLGDMFFDYYHLTVEERKELLLSKKEHIRSLISLMKARLKSKIIVHNFEVCADTPLGIIENKQELGLVEFIESLNDDLRDKFKPDSQVFIFDYDSFLSRIGKSRAINYKMYYLSDTKIDLGYLPVLADKYLAYIKPLASLTKKCIVLDLDNTLWGGIVGEDGIEGIKLGPNPEGRPFLEFQKYILSLFHKGIILAINSKNNMDDALKVIREHPHMILKEEHFASMMINWNDKIANFKAIAKELNIGLDSFVFFDDDKINREMVKCALPQVKVVDLPEDSSLYLKVIKELDDFNTYQITEEDAKRSRMYAQQRKRREFSNSIQNVEEYLKGLGIRIFIGKADKFTIPRVAQLIQKTNQFNMTTRRYTQEEVEKFVNSDGHLVLSVTVKDKFGDNGLTGAAIIKKRREEWFIDSFLLSCREIGRRVEDAVLAYIFEEAKKEGVKTISGEFVMTKKNAPAKDFYKERGFLLNKKEEDGETWACETKKAIPCPDFIEIVRVN